MIWFVYSLICLLVCYSSFFWGSISNLFEYCNVAIVRLNWFLLVQIKAKKNPRVSITGVCRKIYAILDWNNEDRLKRRKEKGYLQRNIVKGSYRLNWVCAGRKLENKLLTIWRIIGSYIVLLLRNYEHIEGEIMLLQIIELRWISTISRIPLLPDSYRRDQFPYSKVPAT